MVVRRVRALMPVLVLGAVSLAFVGVCAALVAGYTGPTLDASATDPAVVIPRRNVVWAPDCSATETTMAEIPGAEVPSADPCEGGIKIESDPEATTPGAAVSGAAHTCPAGPEHGDCVSAAAHSATGTPKHGATDVVVDGPRTSAPSTTAAPTPPTTADEPATTHGGGTGNGRGKAPADPSSQENRGEAAPSKRP